MTKLQKLYAKGVELRIFHHSPQWLGMWNICKDELMSRRWQPMPRKGRRYRYGLSAKFRSTKTGKTIACTYHGSHVAILIEGRSSARCFKPRNAYAALKYIVKAREGR